MNVNEYGIVFRFGVGFDLSGFTSLSLTFTKPDATTLTVTNPAVSVGSTTVTTTVGQMLAHEYAEYTFVNGDVNQAGGWSARLTYNDATPKHLISDIGRFTVSA